MARKRVRLLIVGVLAALSGGCQFLQNEFSAYDRLPPSARAAPAPQPW